MFRCLKLRTVLAIKVATMTITLFMTTYSIFTIGPWLEQRFWPVLDKLIITRVEPQGPGYADMYVRFNKRRDCNYIGIAWFKGSRSSEFERVQVVLMREPNDNASPNRPIGMQRAGPWRISMDAADVRNSSFADIFHKCHPFWTTHTKFYP